MDRRSGDTPGIRVPASWLAALGRILTDPTLHFGCGTWLRAAQMEVQGRNIGRHTPVRQVALISLSQKEKSHRRCTAEVSEVGSVCDVEPPFPDIVSVRAQGTGSCTFCIPSEACLRE